MGLASKLQASQGGGGGGAYGAPPSQGAYGAPPSQGSYGAPPSQGPPGYPQQGRDSWPINALYLDSRYTCTSCGFRGMSSEGCIHVCDS